MSTPTLPPPFVSRIDKKVCVKYADANLASYLVSIGFSLSDEADTYCKQAGDSSSVASLLSLLRDRGVAFSGGADWSPAEVFEYYRDQRLLSGNYQRIAWIGRGDYNIATS